MPWKSNSKRSRFLRAWVRDLTSGKYTQTRKVLCNEDTHEDQPIGYCCLGVACETGARQRIKGAGWIGLHLDAQQHKGDGDPGESASHDGDSNISSENNWFNKLLGSDEDSPAKRLSIPPQLREKANGSTKMFAALLNDDYNFTFAEIAQCIKYTWPIAFKKELSKPTRKARRR